MLISYLFDYVSQLPLKSSPLHAGLSGATLDSHGDQLNVSKTQHETLEPIRVYFTNKEPIVRKCPSEVVKSIATILLGE
tara:strand:+ start:267 stop:503 length:237 start_codon:yes stop_codon:yes gene_type:complete